MTRESWGMAAMYSALVGAIATNLLSNRLAFVAIPVGIVTLMVVAYCLGRAAKGQ